MMHNHINDSQGGILNAYSRDGAYRKMISSSSTVSITDAAEKHSNAPAYTKIKEIKISDLTDGFQAGEFTASYDLKNIVAGKTAYAKLYINGFAVGSEMTEAGNAYVNQSEAITGVTLKKNDLLQIYVKSQATGTAYVENFIISFGWQIAYFGTGTVKKLSVPLALSDTDNPFTTVNQDP